MSLLIGIGLAIFILCYKAVDKQERQKIRDEREREKNQALEDRENFHKEYGATIEETKEAESEALYSLGLANVVREEIKEAGVSNPTNYMVSRGILAKSGKISYNASFGGFTTIPKSRIELVDAHMFLVWLSDELANHGLPYKLLYKPEGTSRKDAKEISAEDKIMSGSYFWEPVSYYAQVNHEIVVTKQC